MSCFHFSLFSFTTSYEKATKGNPTGELAIRFGGLKRQSCGGGDEELLGSADGFILFLLPAFLVALDDSLPFFKMFEKFERPVASQYVHESLYLSVSMHICALFPCRNKIGFLYFIFSKACSSLIEASHSASK